MANEALKGSLTPLVRDIVQEVVRRAESVATKHSDPGLAFDYLETMSELMQQEVYTLQERGNDLAIEYDL